MDNYLLQGLVVDKTGSIFGNLKLALLDLLAKFPAAHSYVSLGGLFPGQAGVASRRSTHLTYILRHRTPGRTGVAGEEELRKWKSPSWAEEQGRIYWPTQQHGLQSHACKLSRCLGDDKFGGKMWWAAAPVRTTLL